MTEAAEILAGELAGRRFDMLIGDQLTGASEGRLREVVDPSTGRKIAETPEATAADVAAAVDAAAAAQPGWDALGLQGRIGHISQFAAELAAHADRLSVLESIDTGNPLPSTRRDMRLAGDHLRDWPALALTLNGRVLPTDGRTLSFTSHVPYGVVARITAFNHPALFAINGVLMPLLVGNTAVVKSSELTSLSTLAMAELFAATLPAGVVNIVAGGAHTGEAIVRDPRVKRIAFIGGVRTGLRIQEQAAQSGTVKNVSLELGGKNAMVVFPDSDLDLVVDAALAGMSLEISQGQSCQATSRMLVHDRLYDEFVTKLAARLQGYRIGPAYLPSSDMGPLISKAQLAKVTEYVETGEREGATLVTGGGHPAGAPEGGHYMEPVLFADVQPDMRIAREEIFGPVIAALRWDNYDTMIETANDVDLGLSASVWSADIDLALETAHLLQAGYIWVNDTNRHYAGAPYGGMKNSGVGREESVEELLSYLELKVTHVRRADPQLALSRMLGTENSL